MDLELIRQIHAGVWAIDAQSAYGYLQQLPDILSGQITVKGNLQLPVSAQKIEPAYYKYKYPDETESRLIVIEGPILKSDGLCGEPGSATITSYVRDAMATDNVRRIVILIDSGGGMVDGTQLLSEAVRDAAAVKEVKAIIQGMAASAAYWVASGATTIEYSSETDMIGSIGVMLTMRDYSKQLAEMGVKEMRIYADQSSEKNIAYEEALKGSFTPIKETILNPTAQIFIDAVKANRPHVKNEALKGQLYIASKAVEMGLVDGKSSLKNALTLTVENKQSYYYSPNQQAMQIKFMQALGVIGSFLGLQSIKLNESNKAELTQEEAEQLSGRIQEMQSKIADLTAQLSKVSSERDELRNAFQKAQELILTAEKPQVVSENHSFNNKEEYYMLPNED
jgi:ClpP class serine protease